MTSEVLSEVSDKALKERLRGIRLLALDVDGVLTNGCINIGNQNEAFKSFYAQDNAGVLQSSTKDYINKLGRELRDKTKAQVVVVTVDTLDGFPVAEYGNALFRKYKLGDAELNNGCLLLVAVKDHKLRIEVGYGLEGALPDGYTGTVRDQYLTPAFKKNDFDKGISDGYTELVKKVAAEYKVNPWTLTRSLRWICGR